MIKDSNPKEHKTFGDWIEDNLVLPSAIIGNWDDVIANIKVQKHKARAKDGCQLYGDEYPLDTPLFQDDDSEGYLPTRKEESYGTEE